MDENVDVLYVDSDEGRVRQCERELTEDNSNITFASAQELSTETNYGEYDCLSIFYNVFTNSTVPIEAITKGQSIPVILIVDTNHEKPVKKLTDGEIDEIVKIDTEDDLALLRRRIEQIHVQKLSKYRLQQISRSVKDIFTADSVAEIATRTVELTQELMEYDFVGFHITNDTDDSLIPIEYTDRVAEELGPPEIGRGDGIAWEAFESQETRVFSDVRDSDDVMNDDTDIRSEIAIPIGDVGLLLVGSTKVNAFSPNNISTLEILCQNAREGIERVKKQADIKRFKFFVELSPDIIQVTDEDGKVTYQSPHSPLAEFKLRNYEGQNITDIPVEEHTDIVVEELQNVNNNPKKVVTSEYKAVDAVTGEERWFETRSQNFLDKDPINGIIRTTREITEQKQTEQKIRQTNEQLDKFTSVVTHDLRNPLNVAKGNAKLIAERGDLTEDTEFFVDETTSSLERMEEIISNMLTLTRSGDITEEKQPVTVGNIMEEAWKNVDTHEATLINNVKTMAILADKKALKQCFENVIRNAIEHGGKNVTVTVDVHDDGFYIEDNGPGIDSKIADELFEMGATTERSGTGYGLGIVNEIIEEHGWEVEVNDEANGARFDFYVDDFFINEGGESTVDFDIESEAT